MTSNASSSRSFSLDGFTFAASNPSRILPSADIDALGDKLGGIPSLPDMIFPHRVSIEHESGVKLEFNYFDALAGIWVSDDKQANEERGGAAVEERTLPKVSAAKEWMTGAVADHGANSQLLKIHKNYDWTYGTDYAGTVVPESALRPARDDEEINWTLLANPSDKILFFAENVLYEDELDDNGVTRCSVKLVSILVPRQTRRDRKGLTRQSCLSKASHVSFVPSVATRSYPS